ncbi:hypothetical protein BaRGS_00039017, partial [Batillaria attramentaria]
PCYHDHSCNAHAFDLPACVHTPYQCHPDEMCVFSVSGHDTKAECQDKAKMPACQADQMVNDPACDPHHPPPGHHACTYCCLDDQCMKSLASPQSAVTGPTAQPQTTPVPQTAPKGSCYTSPCHHGNDFATCSSGQWGCGSDQHCQGETSHNHGQCEPYVAGQGDCRYCCTDEDCVNLKVLGIQPTSTLAPATTLHPCVDEYTGDCSVDFAGQCSDPITARTTTMETALQTSPDNATALLYRRFAHGPAVTVKVTCKDKYLGNCLSEFPDQCSDAIVRDVCKQSCGYCHGELDNPHTTYIRENKPPPLQYWGNRKRVCVLVVSGHDTKADCQDKANTHDCENKMHHNDPHCDPATGAGGQHECHYCCADDQCMKGAQRAPIGGREPNTAPKGSCYTSPCHHGDDFATCSSGDWGCGSDQHCQTGLSHNHGQCDPYVPGQGDCRYCCLDEDCINSNVLGLQPANTTAAASTSAEPCVDEYTGDCSVDFAGQCSDPIVMKVCERTCGIC